MKSHLSPALILSILGLLAGCNNVAQNPINPQDPSPPPAPTAKVYQNSETLKPQVLPPKRADIILQGFTIPVQLSSQIEGDQTTLIWSDGDVEVERETYSYKNGVFAISAGPAESYNAPIPLIKLPLTVGDSWEWKGEYIHGKNRFPAIATITTSQEILNLPGSNFDALLVTVSLLPQTGVPSTTPIILKFWFKEGEGLVRREFGQSSTREPIFNPKPEITEEEISTNQQAEEG